MCYVCNEMGDDKFCEVVSQIKSYDVSEKKKSKFDWYNIHIGWNDVVI